MRVEYGPSAEILGTTRILFCTYTLFWGLPQVRWLGSLPQSFFRPPTGPAQLASSFPNTTIGGLLDLSGVLLVFAVGIGWKTRVSSMVLFAWALLTSAMLFSLGKVDHSFIIWLMVPLYGIAGWGDAYSLDSLRRADHPARPRWPVPAISFAVAFGFLTAALPKLGRGWLSPFSQAAEGYFREFFVTQGRDALLAQRVFEVESVRMWEVLDVWTVFFELAVAVTVLWPRVFRWMLLQASVFHVLVVLIMNISFVALIFVYLPLLAGPPHSSFGGAGSPGKGYAVALAFITALAGIALAGSSARSLLVDLLGTHEMTFAAVAGIGVLVLAAHVHLRAIRLRLPADQHLAAATSSQ